MAITLSKTLLAVYVVERSTLSARRVRPNSHRFFAIPSSVDYNGTNVDFITDSTDWGKVRGCYYSTSDNDRRSTNPDIWRSLQTRFNRGRRLVGVEGIAYGPFYDTPTLASPTAPVGQINAMTNYDFLMLTENDQETGLDWDDGEAPGNMGNDAVGLLVRMARNNAIFFIPQTDLVKFEVTLDMPKAKKVAKALFGTKIGGSGGSADIQAGPRTIGVKNAFYGVGNATTVPGVPGRLDTARTTAPTAPTGTIQAMTVDSLAVLSSIRDFEDDLKDAEA
jgi:hypothetical protein